eukprot:3962739-Prymnesium_polylepis.1
MRRELSRIRRESAQTESRTSANPSRICEYLRLRQITANLARMRVGAVSRHPLSFSARCAATPKRHRARNMRLTCYTRHETAAGAASFIRLSCPDMRQTIPDPPNLPYPAR